MCPAKTRISLDIRPVWSESSLSAWKRVGFLATQKVHSEGYSDWTTAQADQVFAGRKETVAVDRANRQQYKLGRQYVTIETFTVIARSVLHITDSIDEVVLPDKPRHMKICLRRFLTRQDSNQPAQLQKQLESWNFGYSKVKR